MAKIVMQIEDQPDRVLDLEIDGDQIGRINQQLASLRDDHGIDLSLRAYFFSILAVEAIASEPARNWSGLLNQRHSQDSHELQTQFINALSYHLFVQARGLSRPGEKTEIQIFDAIRNVAELSLECRCIFRVPRQTPA